MTCGLMITESLQRDEIDVIEHLISKLTAKYNTIEKEEFADECQLVAHEMPLRLRKLLDDFRNQRINSGHLLLQGFPLDDESIGDTPGHWDASWVNRKILREEIFQCLISSCMGDVFGWLTQENGRFLRHIVPIEVDKDEQLGGSSNVLLLWHVEEAFHPQRADMMTLMCYRNSEKACTNICSTFDLEIPLHYRNVLTQSRFFIEPDKSHLPENNESKHWKLDDEYFQKIRSFLANPEPIAAIQGRPGQENLLVDEAFMKPLPNDEEAREALEWLFKHMTERRHSIVMIPGDILLIDNRTTAHGRSPYVPNYGPKARWLRRVNITSDLTKSYQWKDKRCGRVIR